jgi:hypothetical protein
LEESRTVFAIFTALEESRTVFAIFTALEESRHFVILSAYPFEIWDAWLELQGLGSRLADGIGEVSALGCRLRLNEHLTKWGSRIRIYKGQGLGLKVKG